MNLLPTMVSASDLQRDSSRIINLAKSSEDPIVIMRNNKPEVAMLDVKKLQKIMKRIREFEIKDALEAIREGDEAYKQGKTFVTKDFSEFLDD